MSLSFLTYCMKEIDVETTDLQRQVFVKLGLQPPELLRLPNGLHEGGWKQCLCLVHEWINRQPDLILLCDVDCIPLNPWIIRDVYIPAMRAGAVIGPAQCYPLNAGSTTNPGPAGPPQRAPYAGPAMLGFSAETYKRLGWPPFPDALPKYDVAESFSIQAKARGVPLILLPPTSAEVVEWCLYDATNRVYGPGTVYAGSIFHAMFSRCGTARIKGRCRQVLEGE